MMSSLHSSRRESPLHMSAKFRPKKIFLNFLDYRISFSTKTGRIGQVYCLKKASVGGLSGWLDWLMDKLEENKKDKNSDPAVIGGKEISELLTRSGVSDDRADAF